MSLLKGISGTEKLFKMKILMKWKVTMYYSEKKHGHVLYGYVTKHKGKKKNLHRTKE